MKWLQFILSHSLFIAVCAVALCFQTAILFHITLPLWGYSFIFFSTLCSYNFYWLLSGYAFAGLPIKKYFRKNYSNGIVFIIAAAGCVVSVLHLQHLLPAIAIAVFLTAMYAVPLLPVKALQVTRRAGVLKTFLLAFTWSYITVYIPYTYSTGVNWKILLILFNNRFFFMMMLCIIFDARDTHVDKIKGLQSLTTMLRPATVKYIMYFLFAAYIVNGIFFRLHIDEKEQIIPLLVTGTATAAAYMYSLKKQGYFFYYFLVDGLMLFSALATYVASI